MAGEWEKISDIRLSLQQVIRLWSSRRAVPNTVVTPFENSFSYQFTICHLKANQEQDLSLY
jgi:hypothetical protein